MLARASSFKPYNIGCVTTHSAFCLPVEHQKTANYVTLKAEILKQFRVKFRDVKYVIIDEISMVSSHNLALLHKRRCEIKDTSNSPHTRFGGTSILVLVINFCHKYVAFWLSCI